MALTAFHSSKTW